MMKRLAGKRVGFGLMLLAASASTSEAQHVTAFTHVHVVPMDREHVLPDQTVLVRDGQIVEIGPVDDVDIPANAERIDGRGHYLMPGLTDMHVHLVGEKGLLLYIANGITTVRNTVGRPGVLEWRDAVARGELFGPTIYTAGSLMDGSPPVWGSSTVVTDPAEADSVVQVQIDAGYDFLKVYDGLSRDVYVALLEAANARGLRVAGHIPAAADLETALAGRQASIEHLYGYSRAIRPDTGRVDMNWDDLAPEEREARRDELGRMFLEGKVSVDNIVDSRKLAKMAAATRSAGTWNVPTLTVLRHITLSGRAMEEVIEGPAMASVDPRVGASWPIEARRTEPTEERRAYLRLMYQQNLRIVRALHDASAGILLGTDTPNPFVIPGFSIHHGLRYLVEAGLTPFEAIKAGTADAAEFLNAADAFGTVAVGKRADLILVDGNPLEDVSNVARRVGVMVRGRWLAETELQHRLAELAKSYEDPEGQ